MTELERDHERWEQRGLQLLHQYTEAAEWLERTRWELDGHMYRFDRMMGTAITEGRIVAERQAGGEVSTMMPTALLHPRPCWWICPTALSESLPAIEGGDQEPVMPRKTLKSTGLLLGRVWRG